MNGWRSRCGGGMSPCRGLTYRHMEVDRGNGEVEVDREKGEVDRLVGIVTSLTFEDQGRQGWMWWWMGGGRRGAQLSEGGGGWDFA